jgi:hypothetical protein
MVALVTFNYMDNVVEVVFEREKYWLVVDSLGRIELKENEIIAVAETLEDLEEICPEMAI